MSRNASSLLRRLLALALLPLLTTGCAVAHYYGSISGRVVDKDTGQPIEGAAVVAVYNVAMETVGGLAKDFADAQETQTDAKGDFSLPGKFIFQPRFGMGHFEGDPDVYIAKPGYGEYGYHPKDNDAGGGRASLVRDTTAFQPCRKKAMGWMGANVARSQGNIVVLLEDV